MKKPQPRMSRAEMCEVLEEIARNPDSYPSARESAVRLLQEIAPKVESSAFDDLHDEVALRRSGRKQPR